MGAAAMNLEPIRFQHRTEPRGPEDQPYTFGRPAATYLAPREIVRLTILRSKVRDELQFGALLERSSSVRSDA